MSCCLRAATRMGKTVVAERGVAVAMEHLSTKQMMFLVNYINLDRCMYITHKQGLPY